MTLFISLLKKSFAVASLSLVLSPLLHGAPLHQAQTAPEEILAHFWNQAQEAIYPRQLASQWFNAEHYDKLSDLARGSASLEELGTHINEFLDTTGIPNARFYTPADQNYYLFQSFQAPMPEQRLRLRHVGLFAAQHQGRWHATAVLDGYPAQRAGLRRGDVLLQVDGSDFHPVHSFQDPERPEHHTLTLERDGRQIDVDLQSVHESLYDALRSATLNSVNSFINGNKLVTYLRLWSLSRSWHDQSVYFNMLDELRGSDALIIDLRDGFAYADPAHTDPFFPSRRSYSQVTVEQAASELDQAEPDTITLDTGHRLPELRRYGRPVVIISNDNTRGGLEQFLHQMQRSNRVQSVGVRSAGMISSVEDLLTDEDNRYFAYLPRRRLLLDGSDFEGQGIEVDLVQPYLIDSPSSSDPQFEAALRVLFGFM